MWHHAAAQPMTVIKPGEPGAVVPFRLFQALQWHACEHSVLVGAGLVVVTHVLMISDFMHVESN